MARPKKDAKYVNVYMEKRVAEALDEFTAGTGIPKTRVVEDAVDEYLRKRIKTVNGEKRFTVNVR